MALPFTHAQRGSILWAQVISLAAVQGAIALLWVVYNLYLVDLLSRLGFPATLATGLLVVENLLAMLMEPLMGSLSDRLQHQIGTRLPLISLGVILAAGLFAGLPAAVVLGSVHGLRWSLPLMAVMWALAMTMFRSPALSLLGRYAFRTGLPQAASVLTLVGGVAGAMGPLASQVILGWGAAAAFALGSAVLLIAAVALWLAGPSATVSSHVASKSVPAAERIPQPSSSLVWGQLALVFSTGIGVTLGFRLLMQLFKSLSGQLAPNSGWIVGSIFISLAITAIPAGNLAVRFGNRRIMILGLAVMALICTLTSIVQHEAAAIALALAFGAVFSMVSNGTIPFALSMVPVHKAGLGTGLFFSGGAAAASLFAVLSASLQAAPSRSITLLCLGALLVAGISIGVSPQKRSPPKK